MRTLALAGLAAGLVALHAPAASADHVDANCQFNAVSQATLTGADQWEGVAEGWAVAKHDTVTVRCVVYVNGVATASTAPEGPTPVVAVTAGRVSYTARITDLVQLCPVVTTSHGEQRLCGYGGEQVPPQEIVDLLIWTFGHVDRAGCAVLAALSPGTPPVTIDPEGDVYVDGELWWDCPPYEWR